MPVLVLVLAALALVLVELGAFVVELVRRRRRDTARLEQAAVRARARRSTRGDLPARAGPALAGRVEQRDGDDARADRRARARRARRGPDRQGARRLRLRVAAPAGAHPPAGPRRPGARADGHADPALARARRARRGQRHRAEQQPAPGVQHHRARPADRAARASASRSIRDRLYGQDLSDLEFVAATLREETTEQLAPPARACAATTARATRSTGSSTSSTSASCSPSRSCSPRSRRSTSTGVLTRGEVTVVRSGPDGQTIITKRGRDAAAAARCAPASGSPGQGSASAASTGSPTGASSTPQEP